ncbi:MAG: thioesterase family protein [Candidatus Levybacteria bacterium]|nr:thioesterase family protein [Candidatus Levybacteria bacterium]
MSIRNEIPARHDLFEYVGEVAIGKEGIDDNNHLNYKRYLPIYERQRDLFMATCGIDSKALRKDLGLRIVMESDSSKFIKEVIEGDRIKICTSAEIAGARLQFRQRMIRDGTEVSNSQCILCVKNVSGVTRLPDVIKNKINHVNLTKQPKQ